MHRCSSMHGGQSVLPTNCCLQTPSMHAPALTALHSQYFMLGTASHTCFNPCAVATGAGPPSHATSTRSPHTSRPPSNPTTRWRSPQW